MAQSLGMVTIRAASSRSLKGLAMHRRLLGSLAFLTAIAGTSTARAAVWRVPASKPKHRAVFHVASDDPAIAIAALADVRALIEHFLAEDPAIVEDERLSIELVANGKGYAMLRGDTSPVKDRIAALQAQHPFVVFSACQLSRKSAESREGKPISQLPQATDAALGVARLCELQEQGWSYIRM